MNRNYRSLYNTSLDAWVAVSEATRSRTKPVAQRRGAAGVAVIAAVCAVPAAWAACPADSGSFFRVTTGETCTAAQAGYAGSVGSSAIVRADNAGSIINLTASDVTVTNTTSSNGYALETTSAGIINAGGNLTAVTYGQNGRAIYMAGGTIDILGSLVANHLVRAQGAGIEVSAGVLNVRGTTAINTAAADGLRVGGSAQAHFVGDVGINAKNYTQGILNYGTATFGNNLAVNATNMNAGINMLGGSLSVARDLNITASNTANTGTGITQAAGAISVQGNATISTDASSGHGINISGGTFEALGGDNTITATGASADGIHAVGGVVALGTAASNAAPGSMAVLLAAGSVTGGQHGINAQNAGTGALSVTTAGTVTGTANTGIHATNATTATDLSVTQIGGSVTGQMNGISAINSGSGETTITTAGTVSGNGGDGLYIYNTPTTTDLTITQTGGSITGSAGGIATENDGKGATVIAMAGTIAGTTDAGVYISNSTTTTSLTITQTAGSIGGATDGLSAKNNGSGPTAVTIAGTVTGGTGAGISTRTFAGNLVTINLNNGADVSAASGTAILDTLGNATLTVSSGSKLTGQVLLGEGNDAMFVQGTADISGATLLDGGNSTDGSVADILGTATAATNTLTFAGTTQSLAGSVMKNWQTVTLENSNITFAGDAALVTGKGANGDGSPQGLVLRNTSTLSSPVALAITGDVAIDASSTLNHALGGSIVGDVTNAGLMYWSNTAPGRTLTVTGNYTGVSGSRISLNTYLGDDSSATDKLAVSGNTTGTTFLTVRAASGSSGAQTTNGIQVIQVGGSSAAGSFTLADPLQAGAYQYVLRQGGTVSGGQNWYLTSSYDCSLNNSCPTNPTNPTNPTDPTTPTTPTTPSGPAIYRPGVANYVAGQRVNGDQGLLQLSTYHQRIGGHTATDAEGRQSWLRTYYVRQDADGKTRFDHDTGLAGLQLGQELWLAHEEDGSARRVAVTLDYARGDADFADAFRPAAGLDRDTGSLEENSVVLGGTFAWTDGKGGYVDLVGQFASVRNHYKDSYGDKSLQQGWRTALSLEAGTPVARWGSWQLEPQAQLIYMNTRYQGFDDATSHVGGYTAEVLRGRLGARLFTDDRNGVQAYGIVNVLHDFTDGNAVRVGNTKVDERYGRTFGELGAGFRYRITKDAKAWADARYQQSLDSEHARGYQINAGIKIAF